MLSGGHTLSWESPQGILDPLYMARTIDPETSPLAAATLFPRKYVTIRYGMLS